MKSIFSRLQRPTSRGTRARKLRMTKSQRGTWLSTLQPLNLKFNLYKKHLKVKASNPKLSQFLCTDQVAPRCPGRQPPLVHMCQDMSRLCLSSEFVFPRFKPTEVQRSANKAGQNARQNGKIKNRMKQYLCCMS